MDSLDMSPLRIADCGLRIVGFRTRDPEPGTRPVRRSLGEGGNPNPESRIPSPGPRRADGFTLVEVVVGIFLLTIGLLSLAASMSTAAKRQTFSQSITNMTTLANATLEQIKLDSFTSIVSSTQNFGQIPGFPRYKEQVIVTPNSDDSAVTIQVLVTDQSGFQVSLQTVVAQ
jgi:Tfp pilus assembly protein PilV